MSDRELLESVAEAIRSCSEAARSATIEPSTRLIEDLSLDSLDLVAVLLNIQDRHGVEIDLDSVPNFQEVSDIMVELEGQLRSKAA